MREQIKHLLSIFVSDVLVFCVRHEMNLNHG